MEFSKKKFPRLKDCLPIVDGIFGHMSYTFRNEVTKAQLDYLLLADAAQRNPAPIIDMIYDEDEEHTGSRKLNTTELNKLAAIMLSYYKPRWDKLGDIYDVEYDPIHNYLDEWEDEADGTHEDSRVLDSDRVDTLATTVTKSNTRTNNLTEREQRNLDETVTKEYDAYNPLTQTETRHKDETTTREYDANAPLTESETRRWDETVTREYDSDTPLSELETRNWDETVTREYDSEMPLSVEKKGKETTKESHENIDSVMAFNSADWKNTDKSTGSGNNNESELSFTTREDVTTGIYYDKTTDGVDGSTKEKVTTGKYTDKTTDGEDGSTKDKVTTGKYTDTVQDGEDGSVTETVTTGKQTINTKDGLSGSVTSTTNTGTQSDLGSEATTGTNSRATDETESTDGSDHKERSGRHFGNIGNLTSQKMLNEEIELWKWNYVRAILDDAISFLTLDVYL